MLYSSEPSAALVTVIALMLRSAAHEYEGSSAMRRSMAAPAAFLKITDMFVPT